MSGSKLYVQYGSGPFSAPDGWKNYDASPTLKIQRIPLIGKLLTPAMHVSFHPDVLLGDILKGLPGIKDNACDGIYCSHVLEHLAYNDCLLAIRNSFRMLKPGGYFRCVLPDLAVAAKRYLEQLSNNDPKANTAFMEETLLGKEQRIRGLKQLIQLALGNREHLYMWDHLSLTHQLAVAGFKNIRNCAFNDSPDPMFKLVEEEIRFNNAVALEATK
ncbi:class I SAM-dependent methyltransferase [Pedobacter kyonggii]|uniref:Methyltransferase domain-containing protein n=1 Tax=Pedobacter kyonggii TaxID=1926871 RepID=A0A4Q9HBE4_9SPHI|nr:methyltransferase domain-containing protein [Pedobacter kyonggii]TBO41407.1 methyltransferase domain-containing protein [Pedobacter kyonggii]